MFELTADAVILLLRLTLVALIYLFLGAIALAAARELRGLARRTSSASAGPEIRRGSYLVVVHPGTTSLTLGEALPLRTVTRLGRGAQNTIVIHGSFISGEHATIVQRDGRWWLTDRGSTNGTWVNDRPVRGEVGLQSGDIVVLGDVRLKVAP